MTRIKPADRPSQRITPGLAGISETMLWGLHNRASEAKRADGALTDPDCVRILDAIDYDFRDNFGDPQGSLAVRAAEIDRVIRRWLESHPDGLVVSLGEGLETQALRVDNGRMRWLSVDLPEAIRVREEFLQPTDRFCHFPGSALDPAWMDAVDTSSGVFIVAQGLLMYLAPEKVHQLLSDIADRFPGSEMVFDVVPRWFSRLTMLGLNQTPHYRLPPMPWGINRDEVEPTLKRWNPRLASVEFLHYRSPRGLPLLFGRASRSIPFLRHEVPSLVHLTIPETFDQSPISDTDDECAPDVKATIDAVFAAAEKSVDQSRDLFIAVSNVIAKRVALGMECAFDPQRAGHDEFAGMVPEKMEAFSYAGMIALDRSADAAWEVSLLAYDEALTTTRATLAMATCGSPAALAKMQTSFVLGWFDRARSNFAAIGLLALSAQDAAVAPIRRAVHNNVERLDF